MQCRNCGATIHEGDTFCRTCAMPVNSGSSIQDINFNNVATNEFLVESHNAPVSQELAYFQEEPKERITKSKIGYKDDTSNKKYVERDSNDRLKATLVNLLELLIVIAVFVVAGYFLYVYVLKDMI